ncbi:MAG: hypothetical protein NW237_09395 [Cyanobacteriota bacterium]|nr:hypothetical protein [Cyanobacteriota bacterium]
MTLETFFILLNENSIPITLLIVAAPWLVWILCSWIPGQREEPFLLSLNLALAVLSLALWAGYLAYASNTGGWQQVVKEANILLLGIPPYYVFTSLWVARQRMPLSQLPAFRTLQGVAIMVGAYLVLSWLGRRIHIIFFSYMPFSAFLWILAGLLGVAYLGYRRLMGDPPDYNQQDPESR